MTRHDDHADLRARTVEDLRAAADLAHHRRHGQLAGLWEAAAAAAEQTPVAARWGIPEQRVARDVEEELRWAAVVARAHTLALAYLDERIDLDRVTAGAR